MSNPQPGSEAQGRQEGQQGGGVSAGGSAGMQATAGGDVKQMSVGDLIDLANQQNLDVSALNELLGQVNVSPDVNVAGTGGAGGGQASPGS